LVMMFRTRFAHPRGTRRRARRCSSSVAPVSLVSNEDAKLLEIARFPVAKVGFLDCHARGNPPAKLGLVGKPNVEIQKSFLEFVFDPVHDFPM
jgi:hypothetical protein